MPDDARLLELAWLAALETAPTTYGPYTEACPERRLVIHLLARGFADSQHTPSAIGQVDVGFYEDYHRTTRWNLIEQARCGYAMHLCITHAGAVRRAELEQQLKTGRIKEPMGLIWDGRHFRQDTRIALLDASPERPLGVVYLDLNDVKAFNEKGHEIGDAAIRRYLEVVADLSYDRGDAYRLSGGADEVVVLLPRTIENEAVAWTRKLLDALGREVVADLTLRVAAGVVIATNPGEPVDALKHRADEQQLRAKSDSRKDQNRPSRVAWAGDDA